jgi:hypothetical protein
LPHRGIACRNARTREHADFIKVFVLVPSKTTSAKVKWQDGCDGGAPQATGSTVTGPDGGQSVCVGVCVGSPSPICPGMGVGADQENPATVRGWGWGQTRKRGHDPGGPHNAAFRIRDAQWVPPAISDGPTPWGATRPGSARREPVDSARLEPNLLTLRSLLCLSLLALSWTTATWVIRRGDTDTWALCHYLLASWCPVLQVARPA